jgi:hypothetical protein
VIEKVKNGPRTIDSWTLHDVLGDGNCFYRAAAHQLETFYPGQARLLNPQASTGTELHNVLRARVQEDNFRDNEYADTRDVIEMARTLNVVIAIVDTRFPNLGFMYHYMDNNGLYQLTNNRMDVRWLNRTIIRLAYTGNHYLSVETGPVIEDIVEVINDSNHTSTQSDSSIRDTGGLPTNFYFPCSIT